MPPKWIFVVLVVMFLHPLVLMALLSPIRNQILFNWCKRATAEGHVLASDKVDDGDGHPIHITLFLFSPDGVEQTTACCYSTESPPAPGKLVTVEFLPPDPLICAIRGGRVFRQTPRPEIWLAYVPGFIVVLFMIWRDYRRGLRHLELGSVTQAEVDQVIRVQPTLFRKLLQKEPQRCRARITYVLQGTRREVALWGSVALAQLLETKKAANAPVFLLCCDFDPRRNPFFINGLLLDERVTVRATYLEPT